MNIFEKIKNSIYGPEYYSEVAKKSFWNSLKYLLMFALLFALVFTIFVGAKVVPMVKMLQDKAPQIANYFPQDLTITIKDGKVATNVVEPYFMRIPQELKDSQTPESGMPNVDNIIVINTKDKFDLDTFYSYKTVALLTADSLVYIEKGKISINSLSNIKDFTLNRGKVLEIIDNVKPYLSVLYPLMFVGIYVAGYMVVVSKMVYLLFGALLIWAVAKIKGMELGYKKSYIVGMQLVTGAVIITSILSAISQKLTFPFFFSVLLIALAFVNLNKPVAEPTTLTT